MAVVNFGNISDFKKQPVIKAQGFPQPMRHQMEQPVPTALRAPRPPRIKVKYPLPTRPKLTGGWGTM